MSEYPSDWTTTQLQEVATDFVVPMRDRPKKFKGDIPWIRIEDFNGKWVSRSQSGLCVNEAIIKEMNLKVHPQGTVLCSCSANLGVCAITERPLITNQTFIGIVPDPYQIDTEYLYYLMCSKASQLQMLSSGTTIAYLPRKKFEEYEVCIPPLPEQKKIAEILSGIDEQIMSVKSEIQQARKISTAVTKDLIGTIQDESLPLSEVAVNHDSIRVPIKSEERALRSGPYRYFGASGIIDTIDDFLFDGDYILIGEDGANIIDRNKPLAFKVSGKFWVNNHAHIIQPRESCDINFLTYYLESLDYTGIASGSAQPKITRSALDAIQIPIPPLEVQKKIGAVIESTIDMATTAEKKEKKLIDLKQALSYDLLSGRKRVSV